MSKRGQVRVGTREGSKDPDYKDFKKIVVLTPSSKYGSIGPYVLKDEGQLFENIYQFSRLYEKVPKSSQRYSRFDQKIIWDHPAEVHVDWYQKGNQGMEDKEGIQGMEENKKGRITEAYWDWRNKGKSNDYAVRYPVGIKNNGQNILGALWHCPEYIEKTGTRGSSPYAHRIELPPGYVLLDYLEARRIIYFPLYRRLVQSERQFLQLKKWLAEGINLLIIEVDGPIEKDLPYYRKKYHVKADFIDHRTILINQENLDIMITDLKNRAGHGYALAAELLGLKT
jgi:hypothetical protein